jgi:exodeoxyribonuclease VII small subunit
VTRKKDLSFAEARARLLEILHEVESDGGDVDQLASRLKEAAELHRFCNERLAAARAQVAAVVADLAAAEQGLGPASGSSADGDAVIEAAGEALGDDEEDDEEAAGSDADDSPRGRTGRLPF